MSDRKVAMFFKKPSTNSVCGRFAEEQLNRNIEIPKKRIPWIKYFFQFALPAFLASCNNNIQGKVKVVNEQKTNNYESEKIKQELMYVTLGKPSLKIVSDTTHPISKKNHFNVKKQVAIVLPEIKMPDVSKISLPDKIEPTILNHQPFVNALVSCHVGGLVVTRCYLKKTPKPLQLLQKIFKDTTFSGFRIYPNPVRSNSAFHVEWKQKDFGYHSFQLFNQSGQLVFTNEIYVDDKARLLSINMPSVATGSYFLKVTNKTTGKSFTEKLVVE